MSIAWIYDNWHNTTRVVFMAIIAYPLLILFLRLSGKRTLSKMNAFDLVITVAFGSAFAATVLNDNVTLLEGMTALMMLVILQFVAAWMCVRWTWASKLLKSTPTILFWNGELDEDVCRRERIAIEEVRCAVRQHGLGAMDQVRAIVLETTGDISVIPKSDAQEPEDGTLDALRDTTNQAGG